MSDDPRKSRRSRRRESSSSRRGYRPGVQAIGQLALSLMTRSLDRSSEGESQLQETHLRTAVPTEQRRRSDLELDR